MKAKNLLIALVLFAAGLHCVQCIFYVNTSLLNLHKYAWGQEQMPFQGRVGMMPVLRWGERHYGAYVASIPRTTLFGQEHYTAGKLISYRVATGSMLCIVAMCIWYGVRVRREWWWLCPALAILTFYVSYGARITQAYWYPYDLPHAALFTAASLLLLEGRWYWMAVFFLADVPMRETSVYLIPCLLAVGWVQGRRVRALAFAVPMGVVWLAVHLAISRRFRANPSDVGLHYLNLGIAFHHPHYWPQILTAFGYLWLPLALAWRYLKREQIAFIVGALPGVLVSAVFGIWQESRVWAEWNAVAACLVFSSAITYLRSHGYAATSARSELVEVSPLAGAKGGARGTELGAARAK